jgi:hypothetical protein
VTKESVTFKEKKCRICMDIENTNTSESEIEDTKFKKKQDEKHPTIHTVTTWWRTNSKKSERRFGSEHIIK